jgi:hypothetical protein
LQLHFCVADPAGRERARTRWLLGWLGGSSAAAPANSFVQPSAPWQWLGLASEKRVGYNPPTQPTGLSGRPAGRKQGKAALRPAQVLSQAARQPSWLWLPARQAAKSNNKEHQPSSQGCPGGVYYPFEWLARLATLALVAFARTIWLAT